MTLENPERVAGCVNKAVEFILQSHFSQSKKDGFEFESSRSKFYSL